MKEKIKTNVVLIFGLLYLILFVAGFIILKKLDYCYNFGFKVISIVIILIALLYSSIKIIRKKSISNKRKSFLMISDILIFVFILLFAIYPLLYEKESIVFFDNKKYVEVRYSFLLANEIYYYDYINPIFRSSKIKIKKCYDDSLLDGDLYEIIYYGNDGKIIKKDLVK